MNHLNQSDQSIEGLSKVTHVSCLLTTFKQQIPTSRRPTGTIFAVSSSKKYLHHVLGNVPGQRGLPVAVSGVVVVTVTCLLASINSDNLPASALGTDSKIEVDAVAQDGNEVCSGAMRGTATSDERRAGYIENAQLVATAHELRRSLDPPHQSLFRVVCILLYEDVSGKMRRITGE